MINGEPAAQDLVLTHQHAPTLSVVMPVHNGERFVAAAIESILKQSFTDFEFIIVDDASTDRTAEILEDYSGRDSRIVIARHKSNLGNYPARNHGFRLARGEFLAVMDADDISLPHRFKRQLDFLRQHHDIVLISAWVQLIDQHDILGRVHPYPSQPGLVAWSMLFFDPISHPLTIFRRTAVNPSCVYREEYPVAADFALMFELSRTARLSTIPEVLLHYRTWTGNLSKRPDHSYHAMRVVRDAVNRMGFTISDDEAYALQGLSRDRYPDEADKIRRLASLIEELHAFYLGNIARTKEDIAAINEDAGVRLWLLAALAARRSLGLALSIAASATRIAPLSAFAFCGKVARRLWAR